MPDAGLAGDERGAGVRRDAPGEPEQLLHHGAPPDHPAQLEPVRGRVLGGEQLGAAHAVLALAGEQLAQAGEVQRLGQVVERAELDRFDGAVDRRVRGHQDDAALRLRLPDRAQDVEPAELRHLQIDEGDVRRARDGIIASASRALVCDTTR